jgi:hypothetical protein
VAVVIMGTLSIIALVMASFALAPVVQKLGTNMDENVEYTDVNGTIFTCADKNADGFTTDDHPEIIRGACIARDRTFDSFLVLPMFAIVAIVVWMFLAVTRRDMGQEGF